MHARICINFNDRATRRETRKNIVLMINGNIVNGRIECCYKFVFSGVGKRADEMRRALEVGIRCFNVESAAELERLNDVAGDLGKTAPVALRVNPDVDAKTHPHISPGLKENKLGGPVDTALAL